VGKCEKLELTESAVLLGRSWGIYITRRHYIKRAYNETTTRTQMSIKNKKKTSLFGRASYHSLHSIRLERTPPQNCITNITELRLLPEASQGLASQATRLHSQLAGSQVGAHSF